MKIAICLIIGILIGILDVYYWELRYARIEDKNVKVIKPYIPHSTRSKIEVLVMFAAIIALSLVLTLCFDSNSILFNVRRIVLIGILFPASLSDYRKHIIPNSILLVGIVIWAIITVLEFIVEGKIALRYLGAELICAVVIFACLLFLRLIIKNGIGMGDVKLFVVMALFQAYSGLMSSVFVSLIALFVAAVFLLVTKKKGRKDYIPFAPAILAGTYLSIIVIGA